jgi:hypothetical protein
MSAQETTTTCSTCGSELPARARFCPECGAPAPGATAVAPVPEAETGAVPVARFSTAPTAVLLGLAGAAVVGGIVLFALGHWIAGAVLLVVAGILLAAYAAAPHEERDTPGWLTAARGRARATFTSFSAQTQARRELLALRGEVQRLESERGGRLRALGEAVYAGDEAGTEAERAALRELDDRVAAKEEQMKDVADRARERTTQARLEASSTQLLEPQPSPQEPYPPAIPEPYPPPDEGTPPTPEPVPEPYPPPDEGDPPRQP